MSDRNQDSRYGLSRRDVQEIRKKLRGVDGDPETLLSRVGRLASYPPTPNGNVMRYRFGVSLLLLAVFLMLVVVILPAGDGRMYFAGFAVATVVVAAWQIDLAKKR